MKLKKGEGDPLKTAEQMENDPVFNYNFEHENVERIIEGLRLLGSKTYVKKFDRRRIINLILRSLEATRNIEAT